MQTPQQLAEWEVLRRKLHPPEKDVSAVLEHIVETSGITSRGGTFEFPLDDMGDIPFIQEHCERYGWNCFYEPYYVPVSGGDYRFAVHIFRLVPKKED